jgi:autoinducer 2-degrading protein
MLIIHVHVHVKPDQVEAFRRATVQNAAASVQEPGVACFDVLQQADDPTRFVLVEAYRNLDATVKHKQTAHYLTWAATVTDMMAEPRTRVTYESVFPPDGAW